MEIAMDGTTVIVAGSTSGLGRTIALELATHGANVVVNGRSPDAGHAVVEEIEAQGSSAMFERADINDYEAVEQLVQNAIDRFGEIDVVVASGAGAAAPTADFFRNTPPEDFLDHFLLGVVNRLYLTKAVMEHMIETGGGRIINITTDAGRIPTPGEVAPGSSAAAVIQATRTLAAELRRWHISVNSVALSVTQDSEFVDDLLEESPIASVLEKALEKQEFPLMSDDVAEVVAFLAGASGARPITGQTISVTGGVGI